MQLNFPSYLNKKIRNIKEQEMLLLKEACDLENEYASHTKCIVDGIKSYFSKRKHLCFIKNIIQNTDYQILTSNDKVKN
jgi:hypothetical protein